MRILHIMNHCGFANGNVHAAVDLACAQTARGDTVCMAAAGGEFVELLERHGVEHAFLQQERRDPVSVARMLLGLGRLVRRFRPDVLHAHMMTGAVIGAAVGHVRGVPLVTTVHNAFDGHAILMGLGDLVVGVSRSTAECMAGRRVPRSKLRVVLNGTLGAPRRDFFPSQPVALKSPNVVTISALHGRKGIPDMIAAFEIVAGRRGDVELYIVGDGPGRAEYEALAAASPAAGRIHFLGQLRDTKSFLNAADIFLLTSHDEPFGLVLTEAREAGCAIVATDVGGVPEALDQGAAGLLAPARRPDRLAEALLGLLDDPAELARLQAASRANLERWTIDRVASEYADVYAEAVALRAPKSRAVIPARRRRRAGLPAAPP
ncbi:glycosyltransferase family 4 protein [Phenylobacterium sp.]|jgi:glycosyltransferase involved in cell wall biosynthesis|uniref:glycosyltransferase family 4 protein n=1 Tax=Phenylobacterium sp. TaxID=1871053 RepID=UPI002F3E303A